MVDVAPENELTSFSDDSCDSPTAGCHPVRKTGQYWIEVRVVTRLGKIPVPGVKVKVAEENFGPTDKKGGYVSKDNPDRPYRKKYSSSAFEVFATYVNHDAKLKNEEYRIQLRDVDPEDRGKLDGRVNQRIAKVEDVWGGGHDIDFPYPTVLPYYSVREHMDEFQWKSGDEWTQGNPILLVTVNLATFSLDVGYLNQNIGPGDVKTVPGPGKDPEKFSHMIKDLKKNKEVPWSGSALCSPTCATMLVDYWRRMDGYKGPLNATTRDEVLQRYYDHWAGEGFPERFDKTNVVDPYGDLFGSTGTDEKAKMITIQERFPPSGRMVIQEKAPPAPSDDSYWLSTEKEPFQLYRCECQYDWRKFSLSEADVLDADQTEPESPEPGDLWAPEPPEKVFEWQLVSHRWVPVAEEWWRTMVRKKRGAANRVWKWYDRTARVVASFVPGAEAHHGLTQKIKGRAPLSMVLKGEEELVSVDVPGRKGKKREKKSCRISLEEKPLDEYKKWLSKGWPFIVGTNATSGGHVILIRGAVVDHDGKIHWLIANDPYGNLVSQGTVNMEFDISSSVGRNLDNHPGDVMGVQEALQAAGYWSGDADGECNGDEGHPLVHSIMLYEREKLRLKKPRGMVVPGGPAAKKLKLMLRSRVGKSSDTREARNDPTEVSKVQEVLAAMGLYSYSDPPGECSDSLIAAIEGFQRQRMGMKVPSGLICNGSETEEALQGSYSKHEKEINQSGTNEGDGARGKHVYYRNATPGYRGEMRLGPGSFARVEHKNEPKDISAQLTPGE